MIDLTTIKKGDRIKYIGPAPGLYNHPKSHPTAYFNHVISEINRADHHKWMVPNSLFVHLTCFDKEHPEVACGGWEWLKNDHWELDNPSNLI